jgi:carbon storage regulator
MLVLTRKLSERLYIGDNICVTVVRLEGGQVRLGIEAPREVPVVRAELLDEPTVAARANTPEVVTTGTPPVSSRSVATRGIGIRRPGPSR